MNDSTYRSASELAAGLPRVLDSPKDGGTVVLIVARPRSNERRLLAEAEITPDEGLRGDRWAATVRRRKDGCLDTKSQLALINGRCLELVAGSDERMALAGDNLVVDLDLSVDNLPAGQRLQLGEAEIEITDRAHLGCHKFCDRYGKDAVTFVNSERGKKLRLRGVYARVIQGGVVRRGDSIRKVSQLFG
jgi:hypothetical protein